MEKHYTKNMGEITYVYGVNLEEHEKVIEKQQKRIAELEQDLEFTTKTANELIEIKHKLEQELAELKEKDNYHLRYELAGADETINQLKQQLEEKNKEIERLKVFEKAYYYNQLQASQEDIQKFQQLANQSTVNINYIAIQELEKVKEKINKLPITDILDTDYGGFKKIYQTDAMRIIDQQINVLKGEKYGSK